MRRWPFSQRKILKIYCGIGQQLSACTWFKDEHSNKVTSVVETVVTKKLTELRNFSSDR